MSRHPDSTDGSFEDPLCTIEKGKELYSYAETALEVVEKLGVKPPERPVFSDVHEQIFPGSKRGQLFDGRMPATMRQLSYDQVSHLYNLLNSWYSYINHQLSYWKILRSQADEVRGTTKAFLVQTYHKISKQSMEAARNLAEHDIRYVEDNAEYEKCCAVYALLEAQQKAASHNIDLVSREITIRGDKIRATTQYRGFNNRTVDTARREDELPPTVEVGDGGNNGAGAPTKSAQQRKPSRWDT